jgi:hypothetical protein
MTDVATITVLDEVNINITGIDLATKRLLIKAVEFFLPSSRYHPSYRAGHWNGCKSFATLGGRSYLNALDRLLPILQSRGYEIDIVDQRATVNFEFEPIDDTYLSDLTWPSGHRFAGQNIELRDYQVEAINQCLGTLQGVNVLPTSAGKTIITSSLSKIVEQHGRSIVIVPNKNLVQQTEEDYRNIGLDVGVLYGDRKEYDRTHTICTWQSLNVLDKKNKDRLDNDQLEVFLKDLVAVIVDECFDGDSKVLTPSGYVRIADIKPGDKVINYCESTQEFKVDEVVKQHVNLTKTQQEKMYELEFDNGSTIKVTGNHKFLTNKGWCRADELTEDHDILNH